MIMNDGDTEVESWRKKRKKVKKFEAEKLKFLERCLFGFSARSSCGSQSECGVNLNRTTSDTSREKRRQRALRPATRTAVVGQSLSDDVVFHVDAVTPERESKVAQRLSKERVIEGHGLKMASFRSWRLYMPAHRRDPKVKG